MKDEGGRQLRSLLPAPCSLLPAPRSLLFHRRGFLELVMGITINPGIGQAGKADGLSSRRTNRHNCLCPWRRRLPPAARVFLPRSGQLRTACGPPALLTSPLFQSSLPSPSTTNTTPLEAPLRSTPATAVKLSNKPCRSYAMVEFVFTPSPEAYLLSPIASGPPAADALIASFSDRLSAAGRSG